MAPSSVRMEVRYCSSEVALVARVAVQRGHPSSGASAAVGVQRGTVFELVEAESLALVESVERSDSAAALSLTVLGVEPAVADQTLPARGIDSCSKGWGWEGYHFVAERRRPGKVKRKDEVISALVTCFLRPGDGTRY